MTRVLSWTAAASLTGLLTVVAGGCGDTDVIDHGAGAGGAGGTPVPADCESLNWRNPTPDSVICPGAPGCSCALPQACCGSPDAVDGQCGEVTQCAEQAAVCDGPEDCADTDICCVTPQGTDCRAPAECVGSDRYVLCRATDDCPNALHECLPAEPALLGYCG
jgi:hypothetical protein